MKHIPVLLSETINALNLRHDSVVFDCTFGSGGHAREILKVLGKGGVFVGIDADQSALRVNEGLKRFPATVHLINRNFREIKSVTEELNLQPNAILADLGWRSEQFESSGKGFSFLKDEPLLMTYGNPEDYPFTANDIVNTWAENSIADIIYGYGEERTARKIARAIVQEREKSAIKTAKELSEIVAEVVGGKKSRINPATRTFQALRIAVNDELRALKELLQSSLEVLKTEGRLAIISFHSLEDRIVKDFFRTKEQEQVGRRITKKPLVAGEDEIKANPRSRSAKLRIFEKKHEN